MHLNNDILLRAARGEQTTRPPVWLMRQAGRILPQYRAIRNSLSGFIELVTTPELAAEVTVQPVDELNVDAAIIFSDILVIPEVMGLKYELIEKKGPFFPKTIKERSDIEKLRSGEAAAERLGYVYDALEITKKTLNGRVPLIGFSGAPWTLLAYMIEGQGSKTFAKAKRFLYTEEKAAQLLLDKLTETIIAYLKLKIRAGADIVQIFDSWADLLSPALYKKFCVPRIERICNEITEVPVILFAKGAWFALEDMSKMNCDVLGLDWKTSPQYARKVMNSDKVLQGNLDPCMLYSAPENIEKEVLKMIQNFGDRGHIVNLGHGVYPDTPLDHVKTFVNTVKSFQYDIDQ